MAGIIYTKTLVTPAEFDNAYEKLKPGITKIGDRIFLVRRSQVWDVYQWIKAERETKKIQAAKEKHEHNLRETIRNLRETIRKLEEAERKEAEIANSIQIRRIKTYEETKI